MRASVVIPTYNGGARFREVLDVVRGQIAPWPFNIFVIDSNSNDGTSEYIERVAAVDCKVEFLRIDRSEFQHGRTRNLGVKIAGGDIVAMLTQDAMPTSANWLNALISGLGDDPDCVGAFGRHFAWAEADPLVRRDLNLLFDRFAKEPSPRYKRDPQTYDSDVSLQQSLHFFSDNNSCLRREYWEKNPYPEVEFGEDQLWAHRAINLGKKLIYLDDAAVFHSHSFNPRQSFRRSRTEALFYAYYFGYDLGRNVVKSLIRGFIITGKDCRFLKTLENQPRMRFRDLLLGNIARSLGHARGASVGLRLRRDQSKIAW